MVDHVTTSMQEQGGQQTGGSRSRGVPQATVFSTAHDIDFMLEIKD